MTGPTVAAPLDYQGALHHGVGQVALQPRKSQGASVGLPMMNLSLRYVDR